MKVLLCPGIREDLFEQVKAVSPTLDVVMRKEENAVREAKDAEILFGSYNDEILDAAEQLKWIQSSSAGMDGKISQELMENDIILCNASGLHAPQVAEHAWAITLGLCRGIPKYLRNQADRVWKGEDLTDLLGSVAGIIGFGGIGREYAKRAHAFDMRIFAIDAHVKEKPDYVESLWGLEMIDQLVGMSDVLFIAVVYYGDREADRFCASVDDEANRVPGQHGARAHRGPKGSCRSVEGQPNRGSWTRRIRRRTSSERQ